MELFGPYRLEDLLGQGGMGEVHRAFDTRRQRAVALKRLKPALASDGEYQERFRRESSLAARLSSPHVIPIHDFGEIDGRLFIDMRLAVGTDLSKLVATSGPLPPARAVEITRQVADALDSAHEDGLIHRDVKPSNVLITNNHNRDFTYLVDFGIVRAAAGMVSSLTATGAAVGTLAYMAPELFTGAQIDKRVDVYALGCLLYEALTGRPPFVAEGAGLMFKHLNEVPPSLSAARPDLGPDLDPVIGRALAKNPDHRYPTAGDLAEAAQLALSGGYRPPEPAFLQSGMPTYVPSRSTGLSHPPTPVGGGYPPTSAGTHPAPARPEPPHRNRTRAALIAAAAVVVLGGGTAAVVATQSHTSTPTAVQPNPSAPSTVQSAAPTGETTPAGDRVPLEYQGVWKGTVTVAGNPSPVTQQLEIQLGPGRPGDTIGDFSQTQCSGRMVYESGTGPLELTDLTTTDPSGVCASSTRADVVLVNADALSITLFSGADVGGQGVLTKS